MDCCGATNVWSCRRTKRCVPACWRKCTTRRPAATSAAIRLHACIAPAILLAEDAEQVAAYMKGCDVCQRVKHSQQKTPGLLMPLRVPEEIDFHWTMDFVTGLPRTARGHDAIQGHFSRGGSIKRLLATDTNVDAERAAQGFIESVVRHHGVPSSIVSDRGPQFVAKFWDALWTSLGTLLERSTGYHAQTDGLSEREQKTMVVWLKAFCADFPRGLGSAAPTG